MLAERRTEEALRASEARLRSVLDNLQDVYLQSDLSGRIVMISRSASRMYGYDSLEEMIGLPAEALYGDPRDRARLLEALRTDGRISDWVGLGRRKDGTTFWVSLSAQIHRNGSGSVAGIEGMVRDISERTAAEEERRRLQASVAQADRLASMGMLAAGVAHEINNPLAYAIYHLESLSEDLPRVAEQLAGLRRVPGGRGKGAARREAPAATDMDEALWGDVVERVQEALGGVRKIKSIARGLGTFSRVEPDRLERVELCYPIESAISIACNEIKYRAQLNKDLGSTAPVLASEGRLSQVFLNLLVNAAHAIHEGDVEHNRILLRTWQEGPTVLAEVRDTGAGIPPELLQQIFEPFFTTKPVGVGSGLGLWIVRNILAGYGGTIEVQSEVGAGSRFLIRLPAATGVPANEELADRAAVEAAAARGRVLIIDDDPGIRSVLRRILRQHELVVAESGDRAAEVLAQDQRFDVIVCDVMMPAMSGTDLHRWLVEHHPGMAGRVIFVTGGAFTPDAGEYLERLDNRRLKKPFDVAEVERLVGERVLAAKSR